MKICNVEFDFDILRAKDADRLQAAVDALRAAERAAPKADPADLGGVIRRNCGLIDGLLTAVLGEDYDQRLGIDTDNLRQLKAVYLELLGGIDAARRELDFTLPAPPAASPAPVVAAVDARAKAAAAKSLPKPAEPLDWGDPTEAADAAVAEPLPFRSTPEQPAAPAQPPAPDLAHMNRAQRWAYLKSLAGRA